MMNRNRHGGGRDRGGRNFGGGGDGLLGEGPGMGGNMFEPMMNSQMNQLMLAQQLLQQQQNALGGGGGGFGGGADFGMGDLGAIGALAGAMGNMQYLQQQQQGMSLGGLGGMRNDRKRVGGQGRDMDYKRRRRDSSGRGGDRDRSRGRDSNRSGEGRDRNRSSRWDSDGDRNRNRGGRGDDDYDPAEPTEDEEGRVDRDSNLYCHVCNVSVYDDESFRRHLNGTKHTQRMNSVLTVHQMKSNQLKSRLKAEEHLRKIEGKKGGVDPDYFCKVCNNSLTIPWERHRFSNIHKQRQLQVRRGCGWCNVHDFTNFTEVLKHRETDEHKKNAEKYGKKKDEKERGRSRSRSHSRERRQEKHRSVKRSSSDDKSRKDKDKKAKDRKKQEEEEEDLTIPEFNAENPVGLNYIIPVTGFFCKLCHKFYNNEKSAKGSHCQSEAHYERFKMATQAKIDARQKRLEAEAAAEAERKAKEEEEKKLKKESETDVEMQDKEGAGDKDEEHKEDGDEEEEEEDDEDYDDDLPIEDEDDDGGLVKDEDLSMVADGTKAGGSKNASGVDSFLTATESFLSDTNANSSFVYLSGDMAEAHMELQRQEELQQQRQQQKAGNGETGPHAVTVEEKVIPVVPVEGEADNTADKSTAEEASMELSGEGEDKEEDSSIAPSEEDSMTTSTPVAKKPAAKTRGGGTARRGRSRGKAKK